MLLDVTPSLRNSTEFTIDILTDATQMLGVKNRMQLVQSGTKISTHKMELHCTLRDQLVSELKHIIHLKNNGSRALFVQNCRFLPDFNPELISVISDIQSQQMQSAQEKASELLFDERPDTNSSSSLPKFSRFTHPKKAVN